MSEIVNFKVITGEEIIATTKDTVSRSMGIYEKVRVVQMVQTGPQTVGIGLVPFSPACVDGEIIFKPEAIIATMTLSNEVENAYIQQTTGIQMAGGVSLK